MPSVKRKKQLQPADEPIRKERKIVIDSSEESDEDVPQQQEESSTSALQNGTQEMEEEDEVVAEFNVFLLPTEIHSRQNETATIPSVGINRLQFGQQHPQLINRVFAASDDNAKPKCHAQYKAQVRHLKLKFGGEEMALVDNGKSFASTARTIGGGGGIADLLMKPPPSASSSAQQSSSSASTSTNRGDKKDMELFTGEGYSQHETLSHAVGFFSEGKFLMLPIDKTYEMRKPLGGAAEKETSKGKASAQQKASPSPGGQVPLRVRYARPDSDIQKRRREQSALFKQKQVDQDQWIPLRVEHAKITKLYKQEIGKVSASQNDCLAPVPGRSILLS